MMTYDDNYTKNKNRKKILRGSLQGLILLMFLAILIMAVVTLAAYEPFSRSNTKFSGDRGFVALSYFGVERVGTQTLIGVNRLQEHLQALKNQGYVTITQQDIINYYQAGKLLPEKSLYLMFEDGRRDTAIFSQKILEDLNFKATMMTYPEKFDKKDTKFLLPADMVDLERTTYWEMGSNGYRLAFINVYDRHDNYLGELEPLEHSNVMTFLGRKYNHYLMDYIRDEYFVPKESYEKMKERISYDYDTLRKQYINAIGYVPKVYVLMHSNTGSFGNNDKVSVVNEQWIKELFKVNFNREGFSLNVRNSSPYDLTRMQPQAYWYTNHLLMRIKYDNFQKMDFVRGDLARQQAWDTLKGAFEIQDETMILTCLPKDTGLVRLKNGNEITDAKVSVRLKGNKIGSQAVYLRADSNLSRYLSVEISDNFLYVTEKNGGAKKELFKLNLDKHDGKVPVSIPEDKKAAEIRELETFVKYAPTAERAKIYAERLKDKELEKVPSVAQGAPEYIPVISVHAKGDRLLAVSLKGDKLGVTVDGKEAVQDLAVTAQKGGNVYLESGWGAAGWSQRNLADDVYDGVFEKLIITENTGAESERILFDGKMKGWDAVKYNVKKWWETLINWFIVNL
jgi:hypothetical protein